MTGSAVLFVGDSHSHGYWGTDQQRHFWQPNNYARIYAEHTGRQTYVYSSPGAPNKKYPRWIKHMLLTHTDITAVVIQSTYLERWLMGINRNLEFLELPLDYFTRKFSEDANLTCYDDFNTQDYSCMEWQEKPEYSYITGYQDSIPALNGHSLWPGYRNSYMQIKFHTEVVTHITMEDYVKDITVIDSICRQHGVQGYIWRINDRVEFPRDFHRFCALSALTVFPTAADQWLRQNLAVDIDAMKLDGEHYDQRAHALIADHFIPQLLAV